MAALFISFSWGIRAQQLQIRGKVIDLSDKSPLEFANITLQTADSAFITGTTTDSKGLFPDRESQGRRLSSICFLHRLQDLGSLRAGTFPEYRSRYDLIGILLYILR